LTNFSGDKHAWPLYISIENINKKIRREKSKRAWILAALLPVPPKNPPEGKIHSWWHTAVDIILGPLKHLDMTGPGCEWDCSDGKRRRCYPVLAAWLADYEEYLIISRIKKGACPICEIPKADTGHEGGPKVGDIRDANQYKKLFEEQSHESLVQRNIHPVYNSLWDYLLCNVYQL
jgi:hypothetical protein